jgi:NAD(P)-dependent dehydrogenase (short-subunit alcohol dehydrogenase family)
VKPPLADRTALVIGAGRGIGAAIASELARQGARVVVVSRSQAELEVVVDGIRDEGGWAESVAADALMASNARTVVDEATRRAGKVDILVSCVGHFVPRPFLEVTNDDWERHLTANLLTVVYFSRAVLPSMIEDGFGRVIAISSTAGKYGSPGQSAYNTSKHAVVGLTKCLAAEVAAHGVTVNTVCPGYVDTELLNSDDFRRQQGMRDEDVIGEILASRMPIGRLVRADEVASRPGFGHRSWRAVGVGVPAVRSLAGVAWVMVAST